MNEITYGIAPYKSDDYDMILKMRDEVMRQPIGLTLSEQDVADDSTAEHVWLRVNGEIKATAKLVAEDENTIRLRMVAVSQQSQGMGLGRLIVEFCENYVAARGHSRIIFDARLNVEGFYSKLGYEVSGDVYEKVGIPHVFMSKDISQAI